MSALTTRPTRRGAAIVERRCQACDVQLGVTDVRCPRCLRKSTLVESRPATVRNDADSYRWLKAAAGFALLALIVVAQAGVELATGLMLGDLILSVGGLVALLYLWLVARRELIGQSSHAGAGVRWSFALFFATLSVGMTAVAVTSAMTPLETFEGNTFATLHHWAIVLPVLSVASLSGMLALSLMRPGLGRSAETER